jgi:single-strand DNA-binding protein
MAGEAQISFTGNATADVDLKYTPAGLAVANVTVAVTGREKKGDTWVDGAAAFYRVAVWRDAAENLANSITKGDRVTVVGRLKPREFEQNGVKRISLEVDADSVALDVRFKVAHFAEGTQRSGPPASPAGRLDAENQRRGARTAPPAADPWATPAASAETPW